jgi:Zn-dependent protease
MRDPLSWSIPLFRAFGIQVRLHILYIVITLGFIALAVDRDPDNWKEFVIIWVVLLFGIVLLHEFGHCFAARREGGDASEILMWPLGGLAYCDIPHVARAHFVTAAGGPLVNVMICGVCALVLLPFQFLPPLNPFNITQIYRPQLYNWSDGLTHYSPNYPVFMKEDGSKEIFEFRHIDSYFEYDHKRFVKLEGKKDAFQASVVATPKPVEPFPAWTARLFWMSWVLFLFNLIPAFPLDGGRLLQSLVWGRTGDYRRGTTTAIYAGFAVALVFIFLSLWSSKPMLLGMAVFIWVYCRQQYIALEMSETESVFGYDFSQGYTSLERDDPPPRPKPKKQSFIKRWLQARRDRKALLEAEQRAADEARLDNLLEKIHRQGKESLTDEERRFMDRVSDRYRNRS